ncbi:MAG: hypothetical protein AAF557_08095 [Pseudomonadota bacterium]
MAQQGHHLTGPGASVRKYDLLTALGTFALAADRSTQRRVLRLITLITARYNWTRGEFSVGRREIARLWSVDERTVKREIGALKALGFLTVKRPGARGRVTTYAVEIDAILSASAQDWDRVGPDFADRMTLMTGQGDGAVSTVVPFPGVVTDRSEWSRARMALKAADKARYQAWFQPLVRESRAADTLTLRAPSSFHADYVLTHLIGELTRAVAVAEPGIVTVEIIGPS